MSDKYKPMKLSRWSTDGVTAFDNAENYLGERHSTYYIVGSKHRDSEILDRSNFECTHKELQDIVDNYYEDSDYEPDNAPLKINRMGHWAVGWVEQILIHEDYTVLLQAGDKIIERLEDYAVLDEDDYSEKESEEFYSNLKLTIQDYLQDNQDSLDENLAYEKKYFNNAGEPQEKLYEKVYEYLSMVDKTIGYFSENYPDEESIHEAFKELHIAHTLVTLKIKAEDIALERNHHLSHWEIIRTDYWLRKNQPHLFEVHQENKDFYEGEPIKYLDAKCITCGLEVRITPKPLPNEIDLGGSLLTENCKL